MTVRVLFFSLLRDLTGVEEITWDCDQGSTVTDLLTEVFQRWPALQAWDHSLLVAIDLTYVKRDTALHHGAEVALMPPVQGG